MPDDPTQQQGILSKIGSGLGSALPYAIPAALGAGLGAMSGQGALGTGLGALAGGVSARGEQATAQVEQQKLDMERQKLQKEAEVSDIEIAKGKIALQSEADKTEYEKTISDPDLRQMFRDDPKEYFSHMSWRNFGTVLAKDPVFRKSNPELSKLLPDLPPEIGQRLLEVALSGKYQHVLPPTKFADGKWYAQGIRTDGTSDLIPSGEPAPMIATSERLGQAESQFSKKQMDEATAKLQKDFTAMRTANDKASGLSTTIGITSLPYPNLPETFDEYIASDSGGEAFNRILQTSGGTPAAPAATVGKAPAAPKGDPNAKLAGLPSGKPPKSMWGQPGKPARHVNAKGQTIEIDDKGNVKLVK